MKYFILILNLLYLWGIGYQLIHITKTKTLKENIDESIAKNKTDLKSKETKNILIATLIVISIFPLLYLLFSAIYINTFFFTIVCFIYWIWSVVDIANTINYINEGTITETFNSKLYKILSHPFDLAFAIFMLYQVFLKW